MMKKTKCIIILAALSLPLTSYSASLTQVHVDAGEVGQGFLLKRLNNCYLVTPEHVLGDEFFANVITGTSKRALGEAEKLQVFGYDLSISLVTGAAQKECNTPINSFQPIDDLLKNATSASVSSINADGSKSLTPVSLIDAGLIYLRIKPASDMPLYKGQSGSVVFHRNTPIGILQSVDSNTGEGIVIRIDRTIETIRPFFSSTFTTSSAPLKQQAPTSTSSNQTINYSVTEWSHAPIDSSNRVAHLFDKKTETTWSVKPSGKIISLLLGFDNEMKVITGLKFSALLNDKSSMPKDIQILSTRRAKGSRGWTTIYSGTWINNQAQFNAVFAPVKAKRLKVIFNSNWGSADNLTVSELSVF